MGLWKAERFQYRDVEFLFDCNFCDNHVLDGTYAFGIVREIYLRDCYLKHQLPTVFTKARTVVDLGANRGAFSVLMANRADLVICVEAKETFKPVIRHNMEINGFRNYEIEIGFVGAAGELGKSFCTSLTIEELVNSYKIEQIDLIKIDIEGSEFALFDSANWLQLVNAISMEVHPIHGNPKLILQLLEKHGFVLSIADENLDLMTDPKCANFIYGWRKA